MYKFILIFLLVSTSVFAQDRLMIPEKYIGFQGGITESQIMFTPAVTQGLLQGYTGGFIFRYNADKNVGLQLGLNYSQRGWKEATGLYSRQLSYLEMPFMTHIFLGKRSRFFFNLGPKIGYLLSENVLVNNTTTSSPQQTTNVQNRFDYGLCAGPGFLIDLHGSVIQLDVRAYYALSDIFANQKTDNFSKSNNFNLSVNLGWLLRVK